VSLPAAPVPVRAAPLPSTRSTEPVVAKIIPPAPAQSLKKGAYVRSHSGRKQRGIKITTLTGDVQHLAPLEALARIRFLRDTEKKGAEDIAKAVGLSSLYVYLLLRLERLVPEVRQYLEGNVGERLPLPLTYAFELARLKPELQLHAAEKVLNNSIDLVQLKRYVADPANRPPRTVREKPKATPKRSSKLKPSKRLLNSFQKSVQSLNERADALAQAYETLLKALPEGSEERADVVAKAAAIRKRAARLLVELED